MTHSYRTDCCKLTYNKIEIRLSLNFCKYESRKLPGQDNYLAPEIKLKNGNQVLVHTAVETIFSTNLYLLICG